MQTLMQSVLRQLSVPMGYYAETAQLSFWRLIIVSSAFPIPIVSCINKSVVQLLPHADNIIVLDEGRTAEKGSFDDLNSLNGYVSGLGLKKAESQEIEAVVREEEFEKNEKQNILEKITIVEGTVSDKKVSRGKRNPSALISYITSMGKIYFPIFGFFSVCNVGFRSSQCEWHCSTLVGIKLINFPKLCGSTYGRLPMSLIQKRAKAIILACTSCLVF